jgi:hypothetical protein
MSRSARRAVLLVLAVAAPLFLHGAGVHADAPAGHYAASSGTVLDNKTKLTWQQAQSGTKMAWAAAKTYCAGLGASLGTGWRLPTVKELTTLLDPTLFGSASTIDPYAFPYTSAVHFWSSTPLAGSSTAAWYVDFAGGGPNSEVATTLNEVRCVR